jgi:hypothetical protein
MFMIFKYKYVVRLLMRDVGLIYFLFCMYGGWGNNNTVIVEENRGMFGGRE